MQQALGRVHGAGGGAGGAGRAVSRTNIIINILFGLFGLIFNFSLWPPLRSLASRSRPYRYLRGESTVAYEKRNVNGVLNEQIT